MAAAAAATKQATGGPVKKGGKKTNTVAGPQAPIALADEAEDENLDEVDSEAELESMVKAVRGARTVGLIGTPLALPYDTGTWFVFRRERIRNCKDLLTNALAPRGTATNVPIPATRLSS